MVFNMYDHPITVEPGDISATVCPMMEVTRYYRVRSDGRTAHEDREKNRGGLERRANAGHKEMEQERPLEFPEFFRRLVAPEDQPGVQDQFDRYTRPGDLLAKNIDAIMYGLKIHPDNKMVKTSPWMKRVTESLEIPEGSLAHMK